MNTRTRHPPAGSFKVWKRGKTQPICVSGMRRKSNLPQSWLEPRDLSGVARITLQDSIRERRQVLGRLYACTAGTASGRFSGRWVPRIIGSRISITRPLGLRFIAVTFPPWKRTARSVIASPNPTPPV